MLLFMMGHICTGEAGSSLREQMPYGPGYKLSDILEGGGPLSMP